jgi:hypothetical protein
MKIIFLDVDGVLNTPKLIKKFGFDFIDQSLVALIAKIVKETDAMIVLSSTWRIQEKDKNLVVQSLAQHRLEIHDCTPVLERSANWDGRWVKRSEEIMAWLANNPNVQKFAIIDDFDDANIEGSFFQTDENIGINIQIAAAVINHLNNV